MTIMMKTPKLSRRGFVIGTTAAGAGLSLGFDGLLGDAGAQSAANGDDVGIWVRIKPNNDIVARVTRSEMGQGTITGLVQLAAEELNADWKKMKWASARPTPMALSRSSPGNTSP